MLITLIFSFTHIPILMIILLFIIIIGVITLKGIGRWAIYLAILIFVGAVIIIFIYICSLSLNREFKLHSFYYWAPLLFTPSGVLVWKKTYKLTLVFDFCILSITLFRVVYLFLTLLIVRKFILKNKGPLRKAN